MLQGEAGRKASILIVEDEGVIGAELGALLESMGYWVCAQAYSGRQAIEAAETHRPDLILMDIRIQGDMDGIDASRVIADRFGIPVVFLTAWYDREKLERAKPTMPFGYLVKPVGERELRITIEMALYAAKADAERRAAVRQCLESEQKYRQMMDQAPDALFLTDLDGRFLEVNARACEGLGYSREQLLGLRIEAVESNLDLLAIRDGWDKLTPGTIWTLETAHRRADGSILPVEVRIGRIKLADRDYILGFARDISERKQAGELLRLMRFTLETTPLCIYWLTPDGHLTYVNNAACEMTGHSREELVGMHISRLNPDWTQELRSKNRAERMARGRSTFQTRHQSKDGRVFPIEVTTHFLEFEGREYEASFFQDITERKKTEEMLRLMQSSLETAPSSIFWMSPEGKYLYANEAACRSLGYSREELQALHLSDICPEWSEGLRRKNQEARKTRGSLIFESTQKTKDGRIFPVEVTSHCFDFEGREFELAYAQDISERKQSQTLLRLMQASLETTSAFIFWLTLEGGILYANEQVCRSLGYSQDEIKSMHLADIIPDWSLELRSKNRAERLAKGRTTFEVRVKTRDGRIFPVEVTSHCLEFEGQEYEFAFFQDITARKQSEKMLRLLEYSLETTTVAIFWMNEPGEFIYVNEAACRSLDYTRKELLRMQLADIVPGYRADIRQKNWARRKQRGSLSIESFQCAKDGRIFPVKVTSHYLEFEGEEFEFGFVEDITERKKTEEMLRLMRASLETASASIFWITPDGRYSYANEAACRGLGYSREELVGMHLSDVFPGWNEDMRRRNQELRKSQGGLTFEAVHKTKEGRIFPVRVTTHCFEFDGREFELAYAVDITEKKKSEAILRLMRASLETSSACILWITPEGGISYVNEAACLTLGYDRAELVGMRLGDIVTGWSEELRRDCLQDIRKSGSCTFERIVRAKNGRMFPVEVTSHFLEFEDREYEFAYIQDITERKQTEKISRLMQASLETASASIFWFTSEGRITYVNEAACQSLGYTRTELTGMHLADIDVDWTEERRRKNRELRKKKLLQSFETRYRSSDGRIFPVESTSHYLEFEGREYEFSFVQDISKRKQAECELKESRDRIRIQEAQYRLLAKNSSDLIWKRDRGFRPTYHSPASTRIFGYTPEEMARLAIQDLFTPTTMVRLDFLFQEMNRLIDARRFSDMHWRMELEAVRKNGSTVWVEANIRAALDEHGEFLELVGVSRDITDRKQAEAALLKAHEALEERVRERTAELEQVNQALFQEVLERKRAEDQLLDYQNRLKAMDAQLARSEEKERRRLAADLHDQIGQMLALSQMRLKSLKKAPLSGPHAGELEQLSNLMKQMIKTTRSLTFELSPSILFELGLEQALEWLAEHFAERDGLKIDFACKQCRTFNAEANITIFRAIQELLMNVTKHARSSRVAVALWIENDCQMISVADDGPGFDTSILESKEFNYNRFGLFSLRERLGSIGARLEIDSEPGLGTRAMLRIPIDEAGV